MSDKTNEQTFQEEVHATSTCHCLMTDLFLPQAIQARPRLLTTIRRVIGR